MSELYHFGYSGQDVHALKAWLEAHDGRLIDIRMKPSARDPRWRQAYLAKHLGPHYRHVPALGNVNFRGGPIELADPEAGLAALRAWLQDGQTLVVMCICRDYQVCHRRTVAEVLEAAGWGPAEALELVE